jgi:hypothetical protein
MFLLSVRSCRFKSNTSFAWRGDCSGRLDSPIYCQHFERASAPSRKAPVMILESFVTSNRRAWTVIILTRLLTCFRVGRPASGWGVLTMKCSPVVLVPVCHCSSTGTVGTRVVGSCAYCNRQKRRLTGRQRACSHVSSLERCLAHEPAGAKRGEDFCAGIVCRDLNKIKKSYSYLRAARRLRILSVKFSSCSFSRVRPSTSSSRPLTLALEAES